MPRTLQSGRVVRATRTQSSNSFETTAPRTHRGRAIHEDVQELQRLREENARLDTAREIERLRDENERLRSQVARSQSGLVIRPNKASGIFILDASGGTGTNLWVEHWDMIAKYFKEIETWVKKNRNLLKNREERKM